LIFISFRNNPSIVRGRDFHSAAISPRASTSRPRASRTPAASALSLREPAPVLDEDDELYHKRTPTSSLLNSGISAPRSMLSSRPSSNKKQNSTQPTSMRTKSAAPSDPGIALLHDVHISADSHRGKMIDVAENWVDIERK
jgi:hypothetical protein